MTMAESDKVFVGIDGQLVELTGSDKEAYLTQKTKDQEEQEARETAETARQTKLDSAITKLKQLGLTESEAKIIIGLE
jgi:hypothetical protein